MRAPHFLLLAACLALAGAMHAQTTVLIPYRSAWRYLDDGSNQGTAWRAPAFDDSAWPLANGQFGYGDGDEDTVVAFIDTDPIATGTQRNATTYFRTTVNVPDPAQFTSFTLTLMHDDAGAVFINGAEVARTANLPAGAAYNTFSSAGGSDNIAQTWTLPTSALAAGVNTIAVEIHQDSASSSDVSFDLRLLGVAGVTRGPYLMMNSDSAVTVRWRTASPEDSAVRFGTAQGALTSIASDAAVTTEHEVRVTGLLPDTKYFYSVGSTTAALAGDDADHYFKTAPVPGTDRPMRVWLLGDSGMSNSNQQAVLDAYLASPAYAFNDIVLLLGDNAYDTGTDEEYQSALFDTYPQVLRQSPVWSCLGNHDTAGDRTGSYSGVPYFDMFSFPTGAECGGYISGTERYFSWDFGNIHFISLDVQTNDATLRANMLAWLANDLAANTRRWTIAVWHHPPYTKGSHNSDTESQPIWARQNLAPMLEDAGVDLVVSGHSHSYERSWFIDGFHATPTLISSGTIIDGGDGRPDGSGPYGKDYGGNRGAVYVVAGSSGKASGGSLNHPVMHSSLNRLGSLILDIDGNRLDAKFINSAGVIEDYFTIEKGPVVSVTTPAPDAAEYGPLVGQFTIARSGSTAAALSVQATIGGTAPASRYAPVTVPVTIPAGASAQTVNVTPQPDSVAQGTQTVTLTSTANIAYRLGLATSGAVTITDTPAGAPPIATWRLAKFGGEANNESVRGNLADPDFDSASNLLEYALGLEPLSPSPAGLPSADATGTYLTLSVPRNPDATDVTFIVQVNADLADAGAWSAGGTTILQDTPTLLEVRDNTPVSGTLQRFIRLQVTHP